MMDGLEFNGAKAYKDSKVGCPPSLAHSAVAGLVVPLRFPAP